MKEFFDSFRSLFQFSWDEIRVQSRFFAILFCLGIFDILYPNILGKSIREALEQLSAPKLSLLFLGLSILLFCVFWIGLEYRALKNKQDIRSYFKDNPSEETIRFLYNLSTSAIQIPFFQIAYLTGVWVSGFFYYSNAPSEFNLAQYVSLAVILVFGLYATMRLFYLPKFFSLINERNVIAFPLFDTSPKFRIFLLLMLFVFTIISLRFT
jgi:hypothetical protein